MQDAQSEGLEEHEAAVEIDASEMVDLAPEEAGDPEAGEFEAGGFGSGGLDAASERNLDLVMKIPVSLDVVLGSARMPVSKLMKLSKGSVIGLDRKVGEPIEVVVNGRLIARGEVVLMEDGTSRFGISLTEIVNGRGMDMPADKEDA
ncbi:MAG: flagellar motor switch protein FliN [Aestuariivirgaceae bacterium]